jgi:phage shock protein PspC (stress-responsive transcriptional regulator)
MFSQAPTLLKRGVTPVLPSGHLRVEPGSNPDGTDLRTREPWVMDTSTDTRRLVRRADHRLFAGVAGGLADYTDTNPLWWRAGFILFSFAGGAGIAAYLLAWFLIPRADLPRSAVQQLGDHFPDAPSWLGIGLLVFGGLLLAGELGIWRPAVGWGVLLIGLGFVLFRRDADQRASAGSPPPPSPAAAVATGTPATAVTEELSPWASTAPPGLTPSPRPPVPRAPREHSVLGWVSVGLALALGGLLWMLRVSGTATPTNAQLFATPLAVLALGLLVGAFVGRAKWTILLAFPLVPFVVAANAVTVPLNGTWDRVVVAPIHAGDLKPTYEQSGGKLLFDLRLLDQGARPTPMSADLGIGEIQVLLPKCLPVVISAKAGYGGVDVFGASHGGPGASIDVQNGSGPSIHMDLHVGVGAIDVYRDSTFRGGC